MTGNPFLRLASPLRWAVCKDDLSLSSGTPREEVLCNRSLLAQNLGVEAGRIIFMQQRHTANVRVVGHEDAGLESAVPCCDGIVTSERGVGLVALSADCQGILLVDASAGCVAAVHSGWRGTLANVVGETLRVMEEECGASPERVWAWMGPSICAECFEIRDDVVELFWGASPRVEPLPTGRAGVWRVDLRAVNIGHMERAGVPANQIVAPSECSLCGSGYFSARRGDAGRFGVAVALQK